MMRNITDPPLRFGPMPTRPEQVFRLLRLAVEVGHFGGRVNVTAAMTDVLEAAGGDVSSMRRTAATDLARARRAQADLAALGWMRAPGDG